jgi:MoaA/NifB/PqqE/SkfB family radical SAM enzyme
MKNKFNINKINLHGERLEEYLHTGHTKSPVTVTIDLTNRCNNKCPHCISWLKNGKDIDYNLLYRFIIDCKIMGVKGIVITGGGEPLLYDKLEDILAYGHSVGLKFGLITSGQDIGRSEEEWTNILKYLTWIRFSLDAGTPERYKRVHGLSKNKFNNVRTLIKKLCELKLNNNINCTIGIGYIINIDTVEEEKKDIHNMIKTFSANGLDYFQLRPLIIRGKQSNKYIDYDFKTKSYVEEKYPSIQLYNTSITRVMDKEFSYCHGSHFITSLCANGKLYYCCILKNMPEGEIGDLNKLPFSKIWKTNTIKDIGEKIDLKQCPSRCKNNMINNIIEELKGEFEDEHRDFL